MKLKSKRNKLQRSGTLKKKTVILTSDINDYKENKSSLDEALQKIIVEEDRLSYPEERVSFVCVIHIYKHDFFFFCMYYHNF